ncbi:MAG: hypothetical protein U5L45_05910 [Saprospiraceae bacterium]|nr:hypothetical protein [Saprospiraceae bacterium]
MVHFSGKARKMNHIPFFASEASNRLSNCKKGLTCLDCKLIKLFL